MIDAADLLMNDNDFEMALDGIFEDLKGKVITSITGMKFGSEEVLINTECGHTYKMYHSQDCCEYVSIDDVVGNVNDLILTPILFAEVANKYSKNGCEEWTYYKLATIKGYVDIRWYGIRWYGCSNGYYATDVFVTKHKTDEEIK